MQLPANWKTTLTATLSAVTGLATALSLLPTQLGSVLDIIPQQYKAEIFTVSAIATIVLRVINGVFQKDATTPPNP